MRKKRSTYHLIELESYESFDKFKSTTFPEYFHCMKWLLGLSFLIWNKSCRRIDCRFRSLNFNINSFKRQYLANFKNSDVYIVNQNAFVNKQDKTARIIGNILKYNK